jgi:ubiquinone/menaquinone biosynthesis C-methylase UbiE
MTTDTTYLLGHDPTELARLEHQARMLAPATRTILQLAGIAPGMRVLDLGTGAGDVAFQVAELVGPTGSVVGIDQSVKALAFAAHRTEQRGLTTVSFVHEDLRTVQITGEFDAVVGRLVLLYLPDPDDVLRRFAGLVRPGGIVAVMEYEMTAAGTLPPTTLSEQVIFWLTESFRRSGLDASLGARLAQVMRRAGFADATVLGLQGYCQAGDRDGPRMAAGIIRTLLPVLDKTGVATPDEVDIDTLEDRIARDCAHHDVIFKLPTLVGAWARVT